MKKTIPHISPFSKKFIRKLKTTKTLFSEIFCFSLQHRFSVTLGCSNVKVFTRLKLYYLIREQNLPSFNDKLNYLENYLLSVESFSGEEKLFIKQKFSHEKFEFKSRWVAAPYIEERFLEKNNLWKQICISRRQYEIIRSTNKRLYPCYSLLQRAKKDCYPNKSAFRVTETCAEIRLQDLMYHTVLRLLTYLEDVLELLSEQECTNLVLICKWGCDGSQ